MNRLIAYVLLLLRLFEKKCDESYSSEKHACYTLISQTQKHKENPISKLNIPMMRGELVTK